MKAALLILISLLALTMGHLQSPQEFDEKYNLVVSGRLALNTDITKNMYEDFISAFKNEKVIEGLELSSERYERFSETVRRVAEFNAEGTHTWTKGINKFSDMTDEEFYAHYNLDKTADQQCSATASPKVDYLTKVADEFDWRDYGVVTPVKSQGKCGSCWTFSTIGAMESHYYRNTAKAMNLSEQVLVDCARESYDCHGCKGGLPSYAFNYIRDFGIATNETYPYRANDGECTYKNSTAAVTTSGPFNITLGDEGQLVDALFNVGPVSVAFKVIDGFRDYKEGVYDVSGCANTPNDVNHAVLAVGYGTENGVPYYSVKNSWGPSWGDKGFFKIVRNKNMCGIAVCNSYPLNVRTVTHNSG